MRIKRIGSDAHAVATVKRLQLMNAKRQQIDANQREEMSRLLVQKRGPAVRHTRITKAQLLHEAQCHGGLTMVTTYAPRKLQDRLPFQVHALKQLNKLTDRELCVRERESVVSPCNNITLPFRQSGQKMNLLHTTCARVLRQSCNSVMSPLRQATQKMELVLRQDQY